MSLTSILTAIGSIGSALAGIVSAAIAVAIAIFKWLGRITRVEVDSLRCCGPHKTRMVPLGSGWGITIVIEVKHTGGRTPVIQEISFDGIPHSKPIKRKYPGGWAEFEKFPKHATVYLVVGFTAPAGALPVREGATEYQGELVIKGSYRLRCKHKVTIPIDR